MLLSPYLTLNISSLIFTNSSQTAKQSGLFASLLNISQFFIVAEAGPVSSTVVGHLKTCSIVALGWIFTDHHATDGGILGVLLAIGSIILYSHIMYRHGQNNPWQVKA